jgi:branched-chain amino acid transport system substrate-binding protein
MEGTKMKKLGRAIFILLALTLVPILLFGACAKPAPAPAPPKELQIGALVGLSGAGSEAMVRLADGINLAVDWLNEKGGLTINGQKYLIKLIAEDYKMSPEGMKAAADKLVYNDKVKFLLDACPVPPFKATISNLAESNKVVRMDTGCVGASTEYNADMLYTFSDFAEIINHVEGINLFVESYPEIKKVAFINAEDPAAHDIVPRIRQLSEAHGLQGISDEYYPFGTTDFYPMWTKILSVKPDAIIAHMAFPQWFGSLIKQGREMGFHGPFLILGQGGGDPYTILDIAGKDFATDIITCSWDFNSPEMTPMIKEIAQRAKDKFGQEMVADYLIAWEAVWCLAQGIEKAQSVDPTVVRDAMEKMESFETPGGTGEWGGLQTYGINHIIVRPAAISRIMNGEVEHVEWYMPELP